MLKNDYQCVDNKIIIDCFYDKKFDNQSLEIISNYDKLIFSDYNVGIHNKNKFLKIWKKYYDDDDGNYIRSSGQIKKNDSIFNQKINNLPNIYYLKMGENFNQKINNLPQLNILHLQHYFNQFIDYFPSSLKILDLSACSFNKKGNNIPNSMINIKLSMYGEINKYPYLLDKLYIKYFLQRRSIGKNYSVKQKNNYVHLKLLKELKIENTYYTKIDYLPPLLKKLTVGSKFNAKFTSYPKTLIELEFGELYNQSINNLPDSIIKLKLGEYFNQKIIKLPKSLEYITINNCEEKIKNVKQINDNINIRFNHWTC